MSELRRYEPTARRLQKLREGGATPHSSAVTAVGVLLTAALLALLAGPPLLRAAALLLARDLQHAGQQPAQLAPLLGRHLLLAVAAVGLMAAAAATAAALSGFAQGSYALRPPWRGFRQRRRAAPDPPALALGLLGLAGSLVIFLPLLHRYSAARSWLQLLAPETLLGICWRQAALLCGLTLLHLLWTRARYLQRAMLTHRELQEERKESEGSWLKARRLAGARAQRHKERAQ